MRYQVRCYSAPYENSSFDDFDRACHLCYNLSEEYGHVDVIEYAGPHQQVVASYSWGK